MCVVWYKVKALRNPTRKLATIATELVRKLKLPNPHRVCSLTIGYLSDNNFHLKCNSLIINKLPPLWLWRGPCRPQSQFITSKTKISFLHFIWHAVYAFVDLPRHDLIVDLIVAFDSKSRSSIYAAMSEIAIAAKLIRLCKLTFSNSKRTVKNGKILSTPLDTKLYFRQGGFLSRGLIYMMLEKFLKAAELNRCRYNLQ